MTNNKIKKAMLAGIEGNALYLGNTLVWRKDEEGFYIDIANFDLYEPGNEDRLHAPGTDDEPHEWSWHNAPYSANGSHGSRDCVEIKNSSETTGGEEKPSIYIYIKPETITVKNVEYPAKGCLVYSKKMFPNGRIDIRAKMMHGTYSKSTFWATSSTMNRLLTMAAVDSNNVIIEGLSRTFKYLYEFDVVEYTPSNPSEGDYGTNRAMWTWQENKQSILYGSGDEHGNEWCRVDIMKDSNNNPILTSEGLMQGWQNNMLAPTGLQSDIDPLPWLFLDENGEPHSLSPGYWQPKAATGDWYLIYHYMVCYDGNKLIGKSSNNTWNGCYYFIKNYVRGEVKVVNNVEIQYPKVVRDTDPASAVSSDCLVNSADLHWIKYNPTDKTLTEGSGLDGNAWFETQLTSTTVPIHQKPHAIGTNNNINGPLKDNDIYISDWHTWSLEVTTNGIKYLCDDYAYIDMTHDGLYPLLPTDDYACGLILSTIRPADYVKSGLMPTAGHMIVSSIHFTPEDTSQ